MQYIRIAWEQFWRWVDWHGRIATVLLLVVAGGGAVIVNKLSTVWANVSGAYLWVVTLLTFVVFVAGIMSAAEKLHPHDTSDTDDQGAQALNVQLTPSSGPSDKIVLAIRNNGKRQKFHVQCRILARRNDPNQLAQRVYDVSWDGHQYRETTINHGETRNVLIATADQNCQTRTDEVKLIERVGGGNKEVVESSRWPSNQRNKPEYDLEVSVFGRGDYGPYAERFTLKCGGKVSALELVKIDDRKADSAEESHGKGPDISLAWISAKREAIRLRNIGTESAFNIELGFSWSELCFPSAFQVNALHVGEEVEREAIFAEEAYEGTTNIGYMKHILRACIYRGHPPLEVKAVFHGRDGVAFERNFVLEAGPGGVWGEDVKVTPKPRTKRNG